MEPNRIIDELAKVQGMKLAESQSVVVNYDFDSRALFLLNSVFLDKVIRAIRRDGLERELEVSGPGRIDVPCASEAWAIVIRGEGYTEAALAYCQRQGNDGWAALQHSTTLPESAFGICSMFLKIGRLGRAVSSIRHGRARRLCSAEKNELLNHFSSQPPQGVCAGGEESSVSQYIIDAFYSKGWNLYELAPGRSSREFLEQGAAKSLKVGSNYQLMPVAFDSSSLESVVYELRKMKETFQEPVLACGCRRMPVSYIKIGADCIAVKLDDPSVGVTKPFQLAEKMILESFSCYDRTAFSQKPESDSS